MRSPQGSSNLHDVRVFFVNPVFYNTVTELDFYHYRVRTVLVVVYMESVIFELYLEERKFNDEWRTSPEQGKEI